MKKREEILYLKNRILELDKRLDRQEKENKEFLETFVEELEYKFHRLECTIESERQKNRPINKAEDMQASIGSRLDKIEILVHRILTRLSNTKSQS